ncbi:hypothetical protein [Agromyces seonyuensis]|uniref:Secreted protein n=1 Tax=Agromyces seonyuensis TaxID=2662446 RepID=A0A6I4P256_9MICO|nr:hypothetical protein [Agromyces seonyuensis]MWB97337.1 hypothetical protein [Agromyces seonyuensis]
MQRIQFAALSAIAVAAALTLAGCSTSSEPAETTAAAGSCEVIRVQVRDISNGAQNKLAMVTDPAADGEYLGDLITRVDELKADAESDEVVAKLDDLETALTEAQTTVEALPTPTEDSETPDTTEQSEAVSKSATAVTVACDAE